MANKLGYDPATRVWTPLAMGRPQLHTTQDSPVGLWQFNDTLADTSGNGYTLAVATGTERYTDIYPGVRGVQFDGATRLFYNTTGSLLQMTGDLTIMMLCKNYNMSTVGTTAVMLTYQATAGGTLATNCLYSWYFTNQTVRFLSQSGSNSNSSYDINNRFSLFSLCHMAVTRTSNVIQHYINGVPLDASGAVSPNTTPTGGTSSVLHLGAATNNASFWNGAVASLAIIPSALSAATIKARANACLQAVYGKVA